MKKYLFSFFSLLCVCGLISCNSGSGESVMLLVKDKIEISGDYKDIVTVTPGEYLLKKVTDEGNSGTPTLLVKLDLIRTATKADNFKADKDGWSIFLIGEDGQQLKGGELKLQKGPGDETEAEKFSSWVNSAKSGDKDSFLFTITVDNDDQASSILQNVRDIMLKTAHKQDGQQAAQKQEVAQPAASGNNAALQASAFSFSGTLTGPVGGFWGHMSITCGEGFIDLESGGTRVLKVKSVNGSSLVINAFYNGQYIGYYSGTVSYSGGQRYKGVFHNTVNGGKVDFDLSN